MKRIGYRGGTGTGTTNFARNAAISLSSSLIDGGGDGGSGQDDGSGNDINSNSLTRSANVYNVTWM
jgi:hypothetical protein